MWLFWAVKTYKNAHAISISGGLLQHCGLVASMCLGTSCGPVQNRCRHTTTGSWSCEPVSLIVWSEGRRHTSHWRDESSIFWVLARWGIYLWVVEKNKSRRKKNEIEQWLCCCLPHHLCSCLYGGFKCSLSSSAVLLVHCSDQWVMPIFSSSPER